MKIGREANINAMRALIVEIKLSINRRLFEQRYITEEMYVRAKEIIVEST